MERLLTAADHALFQGLVVSTTPNHRHDGRPLLPHERFGRWLQSDTSNVEAWIAVVPPKAVQSRRVGR